MHRNIPLLFLFALALAPLTFGATPFAMNIVTNTIYQNTNNTPLGIYAITQSATLRGYLGNATSMPKVIDLRGGSVTVSAVVYSLTGFNMSAFMLVKPGQYYKFNYTNATFNGEYIPLNTYLLNTKTITAPQYSAVAQMLFALGIVVSLILLFLTFRILKLNAGMMGGIAGFAVGMGGALLLIYALQFVSVAQVQPYTINAFNVPLAVNAQQVTTQPLATEVVFGTVGNAFIMMDIFISFGYLFLAMLVYREKRRNRKYG